MSLNGHIPMVAISTVSHPGVDFVLAVGLCIIIIIFFFLTLGTYDPEGDEKLRKLIYKLVYDHQSVRSVDGKLSCRRTAL